MNPTTAQSTFDVLSSPLVIWVLGILCSIIGCLSLLLWNSLSKRVDKVEEDFNDHRESVAKDFIPKADARVLRSDLLDVMNRFEVALGERVKDLERVQLEAHEHITELRILQANCNRCRIDK